MDDVSLDPVCARAARQPKTIATGLVGNGNTLDHSPRWPRRNVITKPSPRLHRSPTPERFVPDSPLEESGFEAFLVSTMVVGLAEIGDKTQILSLMLPARFLRPIPIILGILFATIANHAAAGLAGSYFADILSSPALRWILGLSFLSVAVWALFLDKYQGNDKAVGRSGAFVTTLDAFFLAEIGDKTQIATVGLAARFEQVCPVVLGTTLGMMLANIPAVLIGDSIADKLPVKAIRVTAAIVFAALGVLTLASSTR